MNDGERQERPARRSTPISKLVPKSDNELNIKSSKQIRPENGKVKRPISKEALQSFHTPNKHRNVQSIKKAKVTPNTPNTPVKKLLLSELASTPLNFKIHNDQSTQKTTTPKIPISDITPRLNVPKATPNNVEKVPLQTILDQAQVQPFVEIPMMKTESSNFTSLDLTHDPNSLLYQAQLPIVHLNNWYRVTQHQIVERQTQITPTHEVISCQKFNGQVLLVDCIKFSDNTKETALLLNYRQHPLASSKVQTIQQGSQISLNEGYKVFQSLRLYKNWKLQT
ncbi:unnamed protein product [Wickerhamomyces anomalus]